MSVNRLMQMAASAGGSPVGQEAFITAGTFSWVAPDGVTSVSVVCVGGGSSYDSYGGSGGGLGYKNNISVTPGNSYTVVVGSGGPQTSDGPGQDSYFINTSTVKGGGAPNRNYGGTYTGDGGGNGGSGTEPSGGSGRAGGGAGGYSGNGGNGGGGFETGSVGSGGAGGGGGFSYSTSFSAGIGGAGGGVGILGQGSNGSGGFGGFDTNFAGGGGGGSGGGSGSSVSASTPSNPAGGLYGGGGGGYTGPEYRRGPGGSGAVRIIWPGTDRQFPSTNTGDIV